MENYRESMPDVSIEYVEEIYGVNKAAIRFTLEGTPIDTKKKFKIKLLFFVISEKNNPILFFKLIKPKKNIFFFIKNKNKALKLINFL